MPSNILRRETKQVRRMMAKARGNAPKPTRATVMPAFELKTMPLAAAECTGSRRNLVLIAVKMAVAAMRGNRLTQIAKFPDLDADSPG
jgi:hypothetical protein